MKELKWWLNYSTKIWSVYYSKLMVYLQWAKTKAINIKRKKQQISKKTFALPASTERKYLFLNDCHKSEIVREMELTIGVRGSSFSRIITVSRICTKKNSDIIPGQYYTPWVKLRKYVWFWGGQKIHLAFYNGCLWENRFWSTKISRRHISQK